MTEELEQQGNTENQNSDDSSAPQEEEALLQTQEEDSDQSEETGKENASESGEESESEEQETSEDEDQPADYELSVPEGFPDDNKELVAGFSEYAKENKLNFQQAQGVVDWFAQKQSAALEKLQTEQKQREKAWVSELKADPDFGASFFDQTVQGARAALTRFGGKEVAQALDQVGLGSHPAFVKMFARIQKAVSEDSFAEGKSEASARKKTPGEILYPNM